MENSMTDKPYRGFTKDQLENLYNQKHRIPHYDDYPISWKRDSDRARADLETKLDVCYGDHSLETYDVFPGGSEFPVHIFFHGGFWYSQDKANFEFMAHASTAESLALQAKYIPYGPMRKSSIDIIKKGEPYFNTGVDILPHMPTTPKRLKKSVIADPFWWADNGAEVNERFGAWKGN